MFAYMWKDEKRRKRIVVVDFLETLWRSHFSKCYILYACETSCIYLPLTPMHGGTGGWTRAVLLVNKWWTYCPLSHALIYEWQQRYDRSKSDSQRLLARSRGGVHHGRFLSMSFNRVCVRVCVWYWRAGSLAKKGQSYSITAIVL